MIQLLDQIRARLQWITVEHLSNGDLLLSEVLRQILCEVQKDPTVLTSPMAGLSVLLKDGEVQLLPCVQARQYTNTIQLIQQIDMARVSLTPVAQMTQMFNQMGLQDANAEMSRKQNPTSQSQNHNPHESNNYQAFH